MNNKRYFFIYSTFILMSQSILCIDNAALQHKKKIAQYKKAKTGVTKVITALKKREISYKKLVRNLERLQKIIVKKFNK